MEGLNTLHPALQGEVRLRYLSKVVQVQTGPRLSRRQPDTKDTAAQVPRTPNSEELPGYSVEKVKLFQTEDEKSCFKLLLLKIRCETRPTYVNHPASETKRMAPLSRASE